MLDVQWFESLDSPDHFREGKNVEVREHLPWDKPERSVPGRFKNFDLSIEQIDDSYRAHVTSSPAGARDPVAVDPARLDIGEPLPGQGSDRTRDVRKRALERDDLKRIGEGLFRAVFDDLVAEAFRASVERVRGEHVGLRIRLFLDRAPELASLPWEALWDTTERAFLADQTDQLIVRALSTATEAPAFGPAEPPLRLLALLPEPRGESKLGGADEWRQIREHLAPLVEQGKVKADRLQPSTLEALGQRIDQGPCHVLHIVAHGAPGVSGSAGVLKLENGATGGPDPVSGNDLARALERRQATRLVVLNACHGARAAADDTFDGLAQHLLSRGVPAVVAMRTAISDDAAVWFAAVLYRQLARGQTIETAMVEARHALALGQYRTEWATPVLYLLAEDLQIFAPQPGEAAAPRNGGRPRWRSIGPGLTVVAAIGLAALLLSKVPMGMSASSGPCPPPPGLQDLHLVAVEPDVLTVGDRTLTVEEGFCIATKEVSRRDWQEVMGGELRRPDWPLDWPMTDVTPEDAESFLRQLEARDPGVTYRLPTDVEWELAARAGQTTDYFFGEDAGELHKYGNCRNLLKSDGHEGPAPVGTYMPNDWGLYDVHGNVAEWVQWPADLEPTVDQEGHRLALRLGGALDNTVGNCSFAAVRKPVRADVDSRNDTGFRVARDLHSSE